MGRRPVGNAGRCAAAGAGGGSWWLLLPLVALHDVILWATESRQQKAHHFRSQCLTWAPIGSSPRRVGPTTARRLTWNEKPRMTH